MEKIKKYKLAIFIFAVFETIAIALWLVSKQIFFLFNFSYIGTFVAIGFVLVIAGKKNGRHFIQLAIGLYLAGYLGIYGGENISIEGFWYCLMRGIYSAAVIHYFVAKIFGPFIFGRGWCGFACWTPMILDFLPFHNAPLEREKKIGVIRYILLPASLIFSVSLIFWNPANINQILYISFIVGNLVFYLVGTILAIALKDDRAFCKYICPTSVILKATSYNALLRVKCDHDKCVSCGKCKKTCQMNVDMTDNSRKRKNGTECILCMECIMDCPKKALHF